MFQKLLIVILLSINVLYPQIYWGKYESNPVVTNGNPGFWDAQSVYAPSVVYDGSNYKMYYAGFDGSYYQIGLATSSDKINWQKYDIVPVLETGAGWDSRYVTQPSVLFINGIYYMWYTGWAGGGLENYKIGYAISNNGVNWDKYDFNPVLTASTIGNWDPVGVSSPSVVEVDGIYYMWFTGYSNDGSTAIGLATSSDRINWDWYQGNPVLEGNPSGWDKQVANCKVMELAGTYLMWYTGIDGDSARIGYAQSYEGVNWQKYSGNPVLNVGPESWDIQAVEEPDVILDTYYFEMIYSGSNNLNHSQIGYAQELNIGINEGTSPAQQFQLYQNYPNPFNPMTTIKWEIPESGQVKLIIYDILGKAIATLIDDEFRSAGKFEVEFDASSLPSGIYFYQLKAGSFIQTKKMLLIK
jgi:predicted GH43/DUF377 family glycosyl hydrolase